MKLATDTKLIVAGVLILGVGAWMLGRQVRGVAGAAWSGIADGASSVADAINPVSDQNIIYRGVNAVGSTVTGQSGWSLGSAIYDWLHPDDETSVEVTRVRLYPSSAVSESTRTDAERVGYQGGGASGSW